MRKHNNITHNCLIGLLCIALLSACSDDMPDTTFNAYFYHPDSREEFLGEVTGLQACRNITRSRAQQLNMIGTHNWTHICCRKTNFSDCAQQHF